MKRKNLKLKNWVKSSLVVILILGLSFGSYKVLNNLKQNDDPVDHVEEPQEDKFVTINFINVGDLLMHAPFVRNANHEYYAENYMYVTDRFKKADIVMANYETTTNPNRPGSGYPVFNAPPILLHSLKKLGFDVINTNNNHSLDTGIEGLKSTITEARNAGLRTVGTQLENEARRLDLRKEGIKIGILSYSYGYNGIDVNLSQEEKDTYLNYIDEEKMEREIKESNALNDFTFVNMHWGYEYHTKENEMQTELAKKLAEWGVDIVFGTHPHVVQGAEKIGDTYVMYSHGNFISDQRLETLDDVETERSYISEATLEKNLTTGEAKVIDVSIDPTWVYKYRLNNDSQYRVLPTRMYLNGEIDLHLDSGLLQRLKDTDRIISERVRFE